MNIQRANGESIRLRMGTVLIGIGLMGGIVASHFIGLASTKAYTDQRIEKTEEKSSRQNREILEDLTEMKVKLGKIEQILIERYGQPRRGPNVSENRKYSDPS